MTAKNFLRRGISTALLISIPSFYFLHTPETSRYLNTETFAPYEITDTEAVTPSTFKITVSSKYPQRGIHLPRDLYHIQIKHPLIQVQRPYTPISSDDACTLTFLVKKYRDGEVSGYIHSLFPGSEIQLRGPIIDYSIPSHVKQITFIAGGTGITPALQLSRSRPDLSIYIIHAHSSRDFHLTKVPPNVEYTEISNRLVLKGDLDGRKGTVLVCGPDGFIQYIAGSKNLDGSQGFIAGLLGDLGESNVWKL
ncbi:putative FAD-binding protein [Neolecta irregularis DAH-3]|uniref:Putative FAD-binding protein n=1 Tax=Neolecta irregularis (strain DAH-3) TaxID=1198029 RepID=A0A1U7LUR5_NEOID|nr:putative FAD-binding protein [Neolecta irregularis DAH-3]|eukprot:OLL26369.1 putative FAD-binding protein [Neolecta irregularis DAH-3]